HALCRSGNQSRRAKLRGDLPGSAGPAIQTRYGISRRDRLSHGAPESAGNVGLYFNSFIVDMEIPAGGSPLDKRLLPLPANGLFYGQPWRSPEGKAMASRVPKKGDPAPLP